MSVLQILAWVLLWLLLSRVLYALTWVPAQNDATTVKKGS